VIGDRQKRAETNIEHQTPNVESDAEGKGAQNTEKARGKASLILFSLELRRYPEEPANDDG
jgi:hypothetical protein